MTGVQTCALPILLLVYVVVWVVVGVFVADAVAQFFVAAVVGVLEVWRDCGFCVFDGIHGSERL